MDYLSIDHLIVYGFLLITLIVGLKSGKGIKSMREYTIANKMYGTSVLVPTYLDTSLGGSHVINGAGLAFSDGILPLLAMAGFAISYIPTAFFIAPKTVHFDHCLTMGDLMKTFYGRVSGFITGVLALLSALLLAGMELSALGIVCKELLDIEPIYGIMVGGIILTGYSAH